MKREKTVDIIGFFKSLWVENPNTEYSENEALNIDYNQEVSGEFKDTINEALKNVDKLEKNMKEIEKDTTKKKGNKSHSIAHVENNSINDEREKGRIERERER